MLISKSLGAELKIFFDDATKMVNFIKQRPVHSRMFKKLCENLDKDKVLTRVFELNDELQEYFQGNNKPDFAKCFEDEKWLQRLAYMADMFHHLNQLNQSLQGPGENVLTSSDKILGFKRRLNLWKNHVAKGNLELFQLLLGLKSEEEYQ